ncbi:MAG: Gfo/Idh/MocA family protein [Bryobacteraceae bacterium]
MEQQSGRRDFLKTAAAAGLTTNIFTGNLRGANDRISTAFIGIGRMGQGNMRAALLQENLVISAVCDVYEPNLQKGVEESKGQARAVRDFREILADKSIDVVCISTPDHWHAYMTVEACKAGKDVYVEKPISVTIEEGQKMVQAARKYSRVVQAGTQQRSGIHFQKACELVKSGKLGKISFVRTWNVTLADEAGIGNPPDGEPPSELNWDMWLGPAPRRTFNPNRFGVDPKAFSHFRWFWDYAGGMMSDWGVHLLDIVQMAFDEAQPVAATALGGKYHLKDNRETPDTLLVTYEYPGFVAVYENRNGSSVGAPMNAGYGILFQGSRGSLFVDRSRYVVIPEPKVKDLEPEEMKAQNNMNRDHWKNFIQCVQTRQRPHSDIEICHKSTTTCHLGNIALRARSRVDWDAQRETILQNDARKLMYREYRKPWKLTV